MRVSGYWAVLVGGEMFSEFMFDFYSVYFHVKMFTKCLWAVYRNFVEYCSGLESTTMLRNQGFNFHIRTWDFRIS